MRNNTKVIPVRLHGSKKTGGKVEVVLLKKQASAGLPAEIWECLTKPGLSVGQEVFFDLGVRGVCTAMTDRTRTLAFDSFEGPFITILEKIGATPIPPYIHSQQTEAELREAYQTIYAKELGSAAAPTAGLHFTPELLLALRDKGVHFAHVTLHIGLDTFQPVKVEDITDHKIHSEGAELTTQDAEIINRAKLAGGRIIAVGTTSARTLETAALVSAGGDPSNPTQALDLCPWRPVSAFHADTRIFIYPGYTWRAVDAMITNFHLPKSTLLMMISSLAGREFVLSAYERAKSEGFRFFSFGDSMFIV